jgi:hypothetical protein
VAPSQAFALSVDAGSGAVLVVTSDGATTPLPGVSQKPALIQFSSQGSAVVLLNAAIRHVQIVTGLPSSPVVREVDVSFVATPPSTLAVSDNGLYLAAGYPGIVYQFSPAGIAGLPVNSQGATLSFAPGSSDLALVTGDSATLWKSTGQTVLASFPNLISPVAAALESKRLVIADASGTISLLDLTSGQATALNCQCTPLGLFPMSGSSYRLTGLQGGAFKLLDGKQNAILFAPVALAGGQQ